MSRRHEECDVFEKGMFAKDLEQLAKECLKTYFRGKRRPNGVKLHEYEVLTDFCLKTVLRTQLDDRCFDYIHEQCLPLIKKDEGYNDPTLDWPVHALLGLMQELMSLEIPKAFQPGLLLLYFKFCYGIEIPHPPVL